MLGIDLKWPAFCPPLAQKSAQIIAVKSICYVSGGGDSALGLVLNCSFPGRKKSGGKRLNGQRRILIVEDGIIKEQLRAVSDKLVTQKCKGVSSFISHQWPVNLSILISKCKQAK